MRDVCGFVNTGQLRESLRDYQLNLQHLVVIGKIVRELMGPGADCMHICTVHSEK